MIPVTPQKELGCLIDPPVSEPSANGTSSAATAAQAKEVTVEEAVKAAIASIKAKEEKNTDP